MNGSSKAPVVLGPRAAAAAVADLGGGQAAVVPVEPAVGVGQGAKPLGGGGFGEPELEPVVTTTGHGVRWAAVAFRCVYTLARVNQVILLAIRQDRACVLDRIIQALARPAGLQRQIAPDCPVGADLHLVLLL